MKTFSVVIPTKNEEKTLPLLLDSIKRQSILPKEIIVADDSTDKTREVARRYGATIVQGVSDGRIGIARNNGANATNSDIIIFLDADVVLPGDFFEKALSIFLMKDLDIATCYLEADKKKLTSQVYYKSWNAIKRFGKLTKRIITESGACIIVRRKIYERVGGFNEKKRVGEDAEFIQRAIYSGASYTVLPVRVVTSIRRMDIPVHKLALQLVGLVGILVATKFTLGLLKNRTGLFEKMYGKTGGGER